MSRAAVLGCAAALLVACADDPMPGTLLGTYKVTAQSTTNTCGLAAPDPWAFDVQVSEKDGTVYWSWLDGSPLLSGTLRGASVALTSELELNVDASDAGAGPCTMARTDTIAMTMGSGAHPATLGGTIAYAFAATPGSSCGDQLSSAGGSYTAIPCTITYAMTAARQ